MNNKAEKNGPDTSITKDGDTSPYINTKSKDHSAQLAAMLEKMIKIMSSISNIYKDL